MKFCSDLRSIELHWRIGVAVPISAAEFDVSISRGGFSVYDWWVKLECNASWSWLFAIGCLVPMLTFSSCQTPCLVLPDCILSLVMNWGLLLVQMNLLRTCSGYVMIYLLLVFIVVTTFDHLMLFILKLSPVLMKPHIIAKDIQVFQEGSAWS